MLLHEHEPSALMMVKVEAQVVQVVGDEQAAQFVPQSAQVVGVVTKYLLMQAEHWMLPLLEKQVLQLVTKLLHS